MVGTWGTWKARALALALAALGGSGCAPGATAEDAARLAALEAEGEQLDEALDTVEERLLGNQAQLQLWAELGRRHKQVSLLHTQHSTAHLDAMMAFMERTQEKAKKLRRQRVASAEPVLTSGRGKRRAPPKNQGGP
jgi:hypothetical protein